MAVRGFIANQKSMNMRNKISLTNRMGRKYPGDINITDSLQKKKKKKCPIVPDSLKTVLSRDAG